MQIEFDPHKDASNLKKHGIALSEAEKLEWDTLWALEDDRFRYEEQRMIGFAYMGLRLYCVVYSEVDEQTYRIISLRLATKAEIKRYAEA